MPEGTALVGDFARGATLYRKGGLRTDASFGYLDFFRRNLIAIRSEIRSVLGIHYPEFFVEVARSTTVKRRSDSSGIGRPSTT